jgi:hypothetical protein
VTNCIYRKPGYTGIKWPDFFVPVYPEFTVEQLLRSVSRFGIGVFKREGGDILTPRIATY